MSEKTVQPIRTNRKLSTWLALGAGLTASPIASAALIISDINQTVDSPQSVGFDLIDGNTGTLGTDGIVDLTIDLSEPNKARALGSLIKNKKFQTRVGTVSDSNGFAIGFEEGDTVDQNTRQDAILYDGTQGAWANAGDRFYLGLSFTFAAGAGNTISRHFGFLELTRGSITLGRFGFETDSIDLRGVPVTIPGTASVPEPASLALLALGATGLAFRRKRAAVAA